MQKTYRTYPNISNKYDFLRFQIGYESKEKRYVCNKMHEEVLFKLVAYADTLEKCDRVFNQKESK